MKRLQEFWNRQKLWLIHGVLKLTWQNLEILSGIFLGCDAKIVVVKTILVTMANNQGRLSGIAVQGKVICHY